MNDLKNLSDDDLIDRAVRAYFRHANRTAVVPDLPNPACCEVREGKVIIANAYRTLAEYRIGTARLIRLPPPTTDAEHARVAARREDLRYDELLCALADAGFAIAQCENHRLVAIPYTSGHEPAGADLLGVTPEALADRDDLVRLYVVCGEGTVPGIVAHFTQRWAVTLPPSEDADAA